MQGPSISLYIIIVLVAVICLAVFYLLHKQIPFFQKKGVRYACIVLTMGSLGLGFYSRSLFALGMPPVWAVLAVWWMMGLFLMLPLLLLWHGFIKIEEYKYKKNGLTRREFFRKSAVLVPAVSLGISAKGIYDSMDIVVERHEFKYRDFPKNIEKLKIVQLSDTHIGPFFGMNSLERVLTMTAVEKPDMVVITGDLIDDLNLLGTTMKRLTELSKTLPYGIFYSWGNHEYFRDRNRIRKALENSPLTVLENSAVKVSDGMPPIYLLGVDYPWSKNAQELRNVKQDFLAKAQQKVPDNAFKILLSHHPDFIDDAFTLGIQLTLTGHTHGGQVNIAGKSLLPVKYRYMRGIYNQGPLIGYVSKGTGHWMPFRLGCPAEISVFTLLPKA